MIWGRSRSRFGRGSSAGSAVAAARTALDTILDEIDRHEYVDLDDPGAPGVYYRLAQPLGEGPALYWGTPSTDFEPLCVRWACSGSGRMERRREIGLNFGTIASAICAGLPVHQLRNGQVLPDPDERGGDPDTVGDAVLYELDAVATRATDQELRDADRTIRLDTARVGVDLGEVTLAFSDGTVLRGRITTVEMRIGG